MHLACGVYRSRVNLGISLLEGFLCGFCYVFLLSKTNLQMIYFKNSKCFYSLPSELHCNHSHCFQLVVNGLNMFSSLKC